MEDFAHREIDRQTDGKTDRHRNTHAYKEESSEA